MTGSPALLGSGLTNGTAPSKPTEVAGDHKFASISCGEVHTCALEPRPSSKAWCWGVSTVVHIKRLYFSTWLGDWNLGTNTSCSLSCRMDTSASWAMGMTNISRLLCLCWATMTMPSFPPGGAIPAASLSAAHSFVGAKLLGLGRIFTRRSSSMYQQHRHILLMLTARLWQ